MASKTLFLHVGMPKAGSTSIQMALSGNPGACKEEGVFYPSLNWNHSKPILAMLGDPARSFINAYGRRYPNPIAESDIADIRERFLDEIRSSEETTHVVSGETLQRIPAERCRALHDLLAPHYDAIKVVAYVRHPFDWASSRAQFSLRRYARPIASLLDIRALASGESSALPRYSRLQTFIQVFGLDNVRIRVFDRKQFHGNDLLVDFGTLIGKPELGHKLRGTWANVAYSAEAVAILDRYVTRTPKNLMTRFEGIRDLLAGLPGSRYVLPRSDLHNIWIHGKAQIEWLHETVGAECFKEIYPDLADRAPDWSDATCGHLERMLGGSLPEIRDRSGAVRRRGLDRLCDRLERLAPPPEAEERSLLSRFGVRSSMTLMHYARSAGHLFAQ